MKQLLLVDGHALLFQMFFGMPSRIVNEAGKPIQAKYNITPQQYVCFKSLVGDTADNIKGAEKIGIKPSMRASILHNKDRLQANAKLIKLDRKAPPVYGLEHLAYTPLGMTTREVLKGIGLLV